MDVIATVDKKDVPARVEACVFRVGGSVREEGLLLQRERLLEVYVNDVLTMRLGCSEGSLVELVVGRMYTEGMIARLDEVDCISVCDRSMRAMVYLKDRSVDLLRDARVKAVPTCCTMNRTLNDYFDRGEALRPLRPLAWSSEWVFEAARDFERDTPMHRATGGSHSCRLVDATGVLVCCEDIGRHNALDKAVGWALAQEVDLTRCLAFTSGRVPTDMAVKAVRAGIPVLVTRKAVTDRALELAGAYGLTLVSGACAESFRLVCGAEPVDLAPAR